MMRFRSWSDIKPIRGYLAMYCLAVAGALSFEDPFAASITLLLAMIAAIFLLGLALYAIDLGVAVRGLQLLSAFAFMYLGIAAERPINNDVAYFAFIGVVLGVCILTPDSHKNEPHSPAVFD
jgi:hypothetical protein